MSAADSVLFIDYATTVKAGRTHLMDATPITFGQELAAWATQVELGHERLVGTLPRRLHL